VLFTGDSEEKFFSTAELRDMGITDDKVIDAYFKMRGLVRKIGRLVDQHRRDMTPRYRQRKFALIRRMARITDMEDTTFRQLYGKRGRLRAKLRGGRGDPAEISRELQEIEGRLQIIREATGEYADMVREVDRLDAALAKTSIQTRTGYVPHKFFGSWALYEIEQTVNDLGDVEVTHKLVAGEHGFFRSRDDAVNAARNFLSARPDANLIVRPVQFTFPDSEATGLTDKSYWRFVKRVGDALEIEGTELRELIKGVARRPFRRRIAGFTQRRTGVKGYSKDLDRVFRAHIQEAVRYVLLDKLKYRAINTMEQLGLSPNRSANQKNPVLPAAMLAWFRDVNGQKQPVESQLDNFLSKSYVTPLRASLLSGTVIASGLTFGIAANPLVGGLLGSYVGWRVYSSLSRGGGFKVRALTGAMTGDMAHAKLGAFFNVLSPVVNLAQTAINTLPIVGPKYTMKGMQLLEEAVRSRVTGKPNRFWRLLERADVATQFKYTEAQARRFSKEGVLPRASLFLFNTAEKFNRGVAFLGA
ncbi:hypothetical protein LCGC14_2420460, partial [marine sediment metagenome]